MERDCSVTKKALRPGAVTYHLNINITIKKTSAADNMHVQFLFQQYIIRMWICHMHIGLYACITCTHNLHACAVYINHIKRYNSYTNTLTQCCWFRFLSRCVYWTIIIILCMERNTYLAWRHHCEIARPPAATSVYILYA